jgi:hypothetical protein
MSDERQARMRELAWRSRARLAQPAFLEGLSDAVRAQVRFLDLDATEEHERRFSEMYLRHQGTAVADLDQAWPDLSALWRGDDEVVILPPTDQAVGCLVLPFRLLASHRAHFLKRNHGALYVSDADVRRGFSYMPGETENVLVRWSNASRDEDS